MDVFARRLEVRKKRKRWAQGVALAMCATLGVAIGLFLAKNPSAPRVAWVGLKVWRDPEILFRYRNRVNVVIIGRDEDRDNRKRILDTLGRSDSLMVASFTKHPKGVQVLSIPRDTITYIPGYGREKVNVAHSVGGPPLVCDMIRESFGIDVDYYVQLQYRGFKKAVDAVGGVDIDVPKDMKYKDSWGDLEINLKKGFQHLNGEQAHGFVRFRHDKLGDLGRIERQQMMLRALAKKVLTLGQLVTIEDKINVLHECVETNLDDEKLLALAFHMKGMSPEDIHGEMLPVYAVGNYLVIERSRATEMLAFMFVERFDRYRWETRLVSAPPPPSEPVVRKTNGKKRSNERVRQRSQEEPVVIETQSDPMPLPEPPPPAEPVPASPNSPGKSSTSGDTNRTEGGTGTQ